MTKPQSRRIIADETKEQQLLPKLNTNLTKILPSLQKNAD